MPECKRSKEKIDYAAIDMTKRNGPCYPLVVRSETCAT